jgi:hypothetical protein
MSLRWIAKRIAKIIARDFAIPYAIGFAMSFLPESRVDVTNGDLTLCVKRDRQTFSFRIVRGEEPLTPVLTLGWYEAEEVYRRGLTIGDYSIPRPTIAGVLNRLGLELDPFEGQEFKPVARRKGQK